MKLSTITYLVNFALVATASQVVRRQVILSRGGMLAGGGHPSRAQASTRIGPPRRLAAKATSSTNEENPSAKPPKRDATVSSKGPAELYYVDKQGDNISRYVSKSESAFRRSTHPTRPQTGGLLKGEPSADEPLKVTAEGKYAGVIVTTPKGGSGSYKVTGDGATQEGKTDPGEKNQAVAHIPRGGAKAEASVSRPGKAYAISYDSPKDIKVPGEIFEAPKEEKPRTAD